VRDKGYRGHNYPNRFKVWISGQVRRVTKAIRREMTCGALGAKRRNRPSPNRDSNAATAAINPC
jgi:hypothetical protein